MVHRELSVAEYMQVERDTRRLAYQQFHLGFQLWRAAAYGSIGTFFMALRDAFDRRGMIRLGHRADAASARAHRRCVRLCKTIDTADNASA